MVPSSISETFLRRNQNQSLEQNQALLKKIKEQADAAGLGIVVYISMAFGNPYGDRWGADDVAESAANVAGLGIHSISIADTVGAATPDLIGRVLEAVIHNCAEREVGVHMHSTRVEAAAKVLAAYDAGCRRFDSAVGGLGGCPFAQDELVGNIPTEEVLHALQARDVSLPIEERISKVVAMNSAISDEFSPDL